MSTLFAGQADSESQRPIGAKEDLCEVFRAGEKPADRFGIGIEYERLPVSRETGRAVPYAAEAPTGVPPAARGRSPKAFPTIERFLEALADKGGWHAEREADRAIALERRGTRVTIEPGAQIELSGRVHAGLAAARDEVMEFVREADEVASPMGIAFLGLGYHPFSEFSEIGWVPKNRYRIMAPFLGRRGHLAHGMMKATAGCQINLDYSSEQDAMEKLRVAMALSSLVTALCANSPLSRGQANGFASKRSHIWMHTDPDRCGLLPLAFREEARFADYAAYALEVPMMFVVREGRWIDMGGRTFSAYLAGETEGLTPTMADWELHLTTLFPEVRLKSYVEVRGSDSASPDLILAQAALWKGLLYDDRARMRAWDLVCRASFEERIAFHRDAGRVGLRARFMGAPALELARTIIELADAGLPLGEAAFLTPLRRVVDEEEAAPAESVLRRWTGAWGRDPRRLVEALAPAPTLLST